VPTDAEEILYGDIRLEGMTVEISEDNAKKTGSTKGPTVADAEVLDPPVVAQNGSDRSERLRSYRRRRQLEAFHRQCDKLGVPEDVRRRLLKMGGRPTAPDAYAGR